MPLHDVQAGTWGGGGDVVWSPFREFSFDGRGGVIEVVSVVGKGAAGVLQPVWEHDVL